MPSEAAWLTDLPVSIKTCPVCGSRPLVPFLRGLVQRPQRRWWIFGPRRDYCALICRGCFALVGWESPPPAWSVPYDARRNSP